MAIYRKKYYKNIVSHGHGWTLEIHQQSQRPLVAKEIGAVLQGLRLFVQGDQADIDTPIVKTSLEMVFVDAPDLETGKKCGNWEEFYTSNSTGYKVLLYKDGILEWTGYVTPDSFSEDLMYRGSVTIVARDNLGALQDYSFDAVDDGSGMLPIYRIIEEAKNAISFPMDIEWNSTGSRRLPFLKGNLTEFYAEKILFNYSAFVGRNWWEILEKVLYATGLTLRYVGGNKFMLAPLRDIPLYNFEYWADVPTKPVSFLSYGHRELAPAVKTIKESVVYDIVDNIVSVKVNEAEFGTESQAVVSIDHYPEPNRLVSIPVYVLNNGRWSTPSAEMTLFFNPFAYDIKEGYASRKYGDLRADNVVYLAANAATNSSIPERVARSVSYKQEIAKGKYVLSLTFDTPVVLFDNDTKIGFSIWHKEFAGMWYNLRFIPDDQSQPIKEYYSDTQSWMNGVRDDYNEFHAQVPETVYPVKFEIPEFEIPSKGTLELEIKYVGTYYEVGGLAEPHNGAYIQIKNLKIEDIVAESSLIESKTNIVTKYNNSNSLILTRDSSFGFNMAAPFGSPAAIQNGMYIPTPDEWYAPSDEWVFHSNGTPTPLPVLTHQQLLAYYAKPNNVLTGELATPNPTFNALYEWGGVKHLLMSGALNILTGRMEGAVLREFYRYDYMWETWFEYDEVVAASKNASAYQYVHSKKDLSNEENWAEYIQGLPSWASVYEITKTGDDYYRVRLELTDNTQDAARSAIIYIDGNCFRLVQEGK